MSRDLKDGLGIDGGHVVDDFYIGNCHVRICDDYCVKTPEETQAILDRCAEIAYDALAAEEMKKVKRKAAANAQACLLCRAGDN